MRSATARLNPSGEMPSRTDLLRLLPEGLRQLGDLQTAIPRIAKDSVLLELIGRAVQLVPSRHVLVHGDARARSSDVIGTAHLVLTSPPY